MREKVKAVFRIGVLLALAGSAAAAAAPAYEGTAPVTHAALWLMPRVGGPTVSPDGRWVVFPVVQPAYDEDEQSSDLWIVPADGSSPARKLTSTKAAESSVAWSPDSTRVAFVTKREGDEQNQVYVLDIRGGEASRVTTVSTGAGFPQWRPDGRALLFTSRVFRGATDDAANKKLLEEEKKRKYSVHEFDAFPIRKWDRWLDERQLHVFVQTLAPAGAPRDLLAGTELVKQNGFGVRSLDTGEQADAVWTPDGESVVFVATTAAHTAAYASVNTHLFEVAGRGGEPKQLTSGTATYEHPHFSPDGKRLFFSVTDEHDQIYAHERVGSAAWPWSGAPSVLTGTFDRSVSTWAISGDGKMVYLTAEDAGLEKLYSVAASGGDVRVVAAPQRGVYTNLSVAAAAPSSVVVANYGSATEPSEIVRIDPSTGTHQRLTAFAVEKAAALGWRPLQHFWFTSAHGRRIHSMLVTPAGFDAARKYPLLVLIHGGAANMWRDQITLRWNYHLLAQPGYVVLLTDYVGSTGYGEQFSRDIRYDPLRGPADDVNEAADEAIRRFPFIDGTRQVAAGASYGGHLVNWLEATTTRYKALVSHAGLADLEMQWATSDGIYHRELMAGGPPWEQAKVWRDQSPLARAGQFKTPMLLSVGENDYRVPMNNAIAMFSALQRMKVPSRLLVWSNANHWIMKGEDSRHFYDEVRTWLDRWVSEPTAASLAAPLSR